MWGASWPRVEPIAPALAARFLTTGFLGKSQPVVILVQTVVNLLMKEHGELASDTLILGILTVSKPAAPFILFRSQIFSAVCDIFHSRSSTSIVRISPVYFIF